MNESHKREFLAISIVAAPLFKSIETLEIIDCRRLINQLVESFGYRQARLYVSKFFKPKLKSTRKVFKDKYFCKSWKNCGNCGTHVCKIVMHLTPELRYKLFTLFFAHEVSSCLHCLIWVSLFCMTRKSIPRCFYL